MALSGPKFLSVEGTPTFRDVQTVTDPGNEKQLLTWTIAASQTEILHQLYIVCRMESVWKLDIDGQVVASGRTGGSKPKDQFSFVPGRDVLTGETATLTLKSRTGSPIVDCEAYVQASVINV